MTTRAAVIRAPNMNVKVKLTARTMDGVSVLSSRAERHQRVDACQGGSATALHAPESRCAVQRSEQDQGSPKFCHFDTLMGHQVVSLAGFLNRVNPEGDARRERDIVVVGSVVHCLARKKAPDVPIRTNKSE